ncbi:MAG: hypothetical protein ACSLE3_00120 [Microbacteriaceae bacterium]
MSASAPRAAGLGRVLIAVYAILALAATGRSVFQLLTKFPEAPVAYSLSALAAVVYIIATVALTLPGSIWYRTAWLAIGFELVGVLTVGALSVLQPALFPRDAVWSHFGSGYLFVPLVLPIAGIWWLWTRRPAQTAA